MCTKKPCHCCSFESLGCRLRTLKASAALLIIFGLAFAAVGIIFGFLADLYFSTLVLPAIFSKYTLYAVLIVVTGFGAVVTGMGAIYIARTMSDDDCSTRGLTILAFLTIALSLATVGLPAWKLYEDDYFVPPRIVNATTPFATTALMASSSTMMPMSAVTTQASSDNSTMMDMMANDTDANTNTTEPPATMMAVDNATQGMTQAAAINATDMPTAMTPQNSSDVNATSPAAVFTTESLNANDTSSDNATSTEAMTDAATTPAATNPPTTTPMSTDKNGGGADNDLLSAPIDYDAWVTILAPFGVICIFAAIFIIFSLLICCISCCCAERSEIVDDIALYKTG